MEKILLALDFGGTKHTLGVISADLLRVDVGKVVPTLGMSTTATPGKRAWRVYRRVYSPPGANARYDLSTVFGVARELLGKDSPAAIGVSFGGPVNADTGVVRLSHHVPGWENIPLKAILEDEFHCPVQVDNDANVAAVGEYHFGAGQGLSSLCYLTVSTGVGGGWILNKKPWRGADGMAGEIGHTTIDPAGPVCLCGKRGCVERLASGPYLAQDARQSLQSVPKNLLKTAESYPGSHILALVKGDLNAITGQIISQAAGMGDSLAQELLDRSAWALGVGIGNAANLINPQCFILGGGVTKAGESFWQRLRQVARQTALPEVNFDVVPAGLDDDAPLWGAAALAEDCLQ